MTVFKVETQHHIDACGLFCPEPVMLLHNKVREMATGDHLIVEATDPSTQRDIPKFCHFLGHELVDNCERDERFYFLIKKG